MNKHFVEAFIEELVNGAISDTALANRLNDDPVSVFRDAGFAVPDGYEAEFESLISELLHPIVVGRLAGKTYSSIGGITCAACKIGAFGIASTLVGFGAVGLATLSASSPIVVALASYAGVSAAAALAFIVGAGSYIAGGVSSLVSEICRWIGACV